MEDIREGTPEWRADVMAVLDHCTDNMKLFMGHNMSCYIQKRIIDTEYAYVLQQEEETTAFALLDYKMKFKPISLREKTAEFYGENGLSWHGSAVQYKKRRTSIELEQERKRNERLILNEHAADVKQTSYSDLSGQMDAYFMDHIAENEKTQDGIAVVSIFEAVFGKISGNTPTIK